MRLWTGVEICSILDRFPACNVNSYLTPAGVWTFDRKGYLCDYMNYYLPLSVPILTRFFFWVKLTPVKFFFSKEQCKLLLDGNKLHKPNSGRNSILFETPVLAVGQGLPIHPRWSRGHLMMWLELFIGIGMHCQFLVKGFSACFWAREMQSLLCFEAGCSILHKIPTLRLLMTIIPVGRCLKGEMHSTVFSCLFYCI